MAEKIRVLYVDDESALLDIAKVYLEKTNDFSVTTATSAQAGLNLLKSGKIDAIVSDYQMPEMDGIEFLKIVRARGDRTPFIIFTGKGREEVVIEALNSGADFYLQKGGESKAQFAELSNKIRYAVFRKQAEDALRKERDLAQRNLDIAGVMMVALNTEGIITLINKKGCEILGYEEKELIGKNWFDQCVPQSIRQGVKDVYNSLQSGKIAPVEYYENVVLTKDGNERYIAFHNAVLFDQSSGISGVLFSGEDITERKKAEAALRESEARYRVFIDSTDDIAYLKDDQFRYLIANRVLAVYFGRTETEILGKTDYELMPEQNASLCFESDKKVFESDAVLITEERLGDRVFETHKFKVPLISGTYGIGGYIKDITDHKKAEEVRRQSDARFTELFDTVSSGVAIYEVKNDGLSGKDYIIKDFNKAALAIEGRKKEEVVGKSLFDMRPTIDDYGLIPVFRGVWKTGNPAYYPTKFYVDENFANYYENRVFRLPGGEIVAIYNDVTEQKRAEEALQNSLSFLNNLIDQSPAPMWISDKNGTLIRINKACCDLLNISLADVVGKYNIFSDNLVEEQGFLPLVRNVFDKGQVAHFQINYDTKKLNILDLTTSASVILAVTIFPVKDAEGKITNAVIQHINITERKKAEEALQFTNTILTSQMESTIDGILVVDESGKIISYNHRFIEIWEIPPDVIASRSDDRALQSVLHKLVNPDEFLARVKYLYTHKEEKSREEVRLNDTRTLDRYSAPMIGSDGWNYGRIWFFRDISDRKQAELELISAQQELKEVHRLAHIGTWDWVIETDTVSWSEELCEIAGWDPTKPAPTYAELPRSYTPDSWERLSAAVTRAVTDGEPYNLELELVRPDGSIRWTNAFGDVKRDVAGNIVGLHGTVQDITTQKLADESDRKSKEFLNTIINSIGDPVYVKDRQHRLIMVNDAACEIFGRSRDEILGMTGYDLFPRREMADRSFERDEEVFVTGRDSISEETNVYAQKKTMTVLVRKSRFVDESGDQFLVGISVNITELKRIEEALKDSEERISRILNGVVDVIWSLSWPDLNVFYISPSVEKVYGRPVQQFIATPSLWADVTHPDDKHLTEDALEQLRNVGSAVRVCRIVRPDGSIAWIHDKSHLIFDEHGTQIRVDGITTDITEQKRMEETLRESEEQHRVLLESLSEFVLVYTGDRILYANPPLLHRLGISGEEMYSTSLFDFIAPESKAIVATNIRRREAGEIVSPYEIVVILPSGERMTLYLQPSIHTIIYKGVRATSIVLTDITECKRAEDALRQANKQLNLLSSITRHDIKNQLLALKGYLELSHDEINNPTTLTEYIKKEEQAANTIEAQIMFTKDYQELGAAAPEWQSVNASIKKALLGLPMRDIRVEPDPADPEIYADPLFERVFYNLIDNALRYGGADMKTIRISSEESATGLLIVCEDDGVGISAEDKKRLFTRGFGKNTGLGLFLSREILAITSITITENGIPGKGARFEITVPKGMWRMKRVDREGD